MKRSDVIRYLALVAALASVSLPQNAFAAAFPVDPATTVTATMDGGTAKTGNTWYEQGANAAAPTTGLKLGLIFGQTDPLSTYQFQPANANNAFMLDSGTSSGTLTFNRAVSVTALSLAGSSGNGSGTVTMTLHFSDSTSDTLAPVTLGDWFNVNVPRVQTAMGRVNVNNTVNNVGADNPRVYAVNLTLSAADAAKTISTIGLTWTGSGANTHTAVFGVSGDIGGLGHFSAIALTGASYNQDIIVGASEVPEPGLLALFGAALGLLGFARRKN